MQKLLDVLQEKNISRHQLALMAKISPSDLYSVFSGKGFMHPGWKHRIAACLEMSEDDLCDSDGGEND